MNKASNAAGKPTGHVAPSVLVSVGSARGEDLGDEHQTRLETDTPGTEPQGARDLVPKVVVQVENKLNHPLPSQVPVDAGSGGQGGWYELLKGRNGVVTGFVAGTASLTMLGVHGMLEGPLIPGEIAGRVVWYVVTSVLVGLLTCVTVKVVEPHMTRS